MYKQNNKVLWITIGGILPLIVIHINCFTYLLPYDGVIRWIGFVLFNGFFFIAAEDFII